MGSEKGGRISDQAVRKATGKSWRQWETALNKAGAGGKPHKEITPLVRKIAPDITGWWVQMVTVGYEQATGLRVLHEKPGGFDVSVSRTINVPVSKAYTAFANSQSRKSWLGDDALEITTSTKDKSLRAIWRSGAMRIGVNLYDKGAGKCQVAVQHMKLKSASDAECKKAYWRDRLEALKERLESLVSGATT